MSESAASNIARLVEQARAPSAPLDARHAAFTRLVLQSQRLAFGLALASLRDVEDARDAAQDAFATVWHRLPQLRNPNAFTPWLKSIVASECSRRRRKRLHPAGRMTPAVPVESDNRQLDYESVIAAALERLPVRERDVIVLYYFLGHTLPQIAQRLRLKPGTVGKRLHSARLRIRRGLPRSTRHDFVRVVPNEAFAARVRRGLLDEYVGVYVFERRHDHVVSISREGDSLLSIGGGQRHLLMSAGDDSLVVGDYDGEGRFRRDRRGVVTHLVYYEFGRRMGVARKVEGRSHQR